MWWNWIALLAAQFTLGAGFGFILAGIYFRAKRRKQRSKLDRLLDLEVRMSGFIEPGVAYVHPSAFESAPSFEQRELMKRYGDEREG